MKRKTIILLILLYLFSPTIVNAKKGYYINQYGVSLTATEYAFFSNMFWEGCQNLITEENYQKFIESRIIHGNFDMNIYTPIIPRSTLVSDSNKSIKIAKVCSTTCTISITATWNKNPLIRSYDVMGALFENTSLLNTPTTNITSSTYSNRITTVDKKSNGYGVSIQVPGGSGIVINQIFKAKLGGKVFASYQHANKTISLNDSKNYTISKTGYGNVFKFSGIASSIYDRMNGVSIGL